MLDEKFSLTLSDSEMKSFKTKHGFAEENILLIMGGGDGIPHGELILQNLLQQKIDFEIVFVCGKNKKLYNFAVEVKEKGNYDNLKVYGYVDFVYELLSVSDLVITKCGASTFMEILLMKKVPLVNSYIWEQEKGNVDFLVKNKLGIYEKRIPKLTEIAKELFADRNKLNEYKKNIEDYNFENGTAKAAEFILK